MKKRTRFLSVLLTLMMLLGLVPATGVPASAAGDVVYGVDVTGITAPVHGASPRFEGADPQTSAAVIADIGWFDQSGYRWMSASDKFVSGQKYTVYVYLAPASGNQFADPNDFVFATINGKDAEVLGVYGHSEQRALLYTFTATDAVVYGVDVTGITAPVHGASPRFEGADPQTSAAVIADIGWFDQSGYRWMSASDKFVSGQKYTVYVYLAPASGNQFADPNDFVFATINGKDAEVLGVYGHSEQRALLYTFTAQADPTLSEVYVGLDAPVVGAAPDTYGGTGTYDYSAGKATWSPADSVFQAGVAYTVTVAVDIDYFDGVFDENARVYVNSQEGTLVSGGGTKHILISYTFPVLNGAPVITAQPEDVSIKAGGTAAFTVEADGENLHYQWWMVDAGVPTKVGTDSATLTLTNLDQGWDKFDFWCVVSNEQGEATSEKAHLTVSPQGQKSAFADVPEEAYYNQPVVWAVEKGITNGTTDTTFSPNAACTRAQAVTFLWRAAGSPAPKSSTMPFEDVAAGSYYETAVLWCVEQGVTVGTAETTFSPNAKCTRAQIVTFLWRSQKSPAAGSVNPFTDVAADAYYNSAVLWAVENSITAGTTAATFSPNNDCTRAQIVTFLYRCLGK